MPLRIEESMLNQSTDGLVEVNVRNEFGTTCSIGLKNLVEIVAISIGSNQYGSISSSMCSYQLVRN